MRSDGSLLDRFVRRALSSPVVGVVLVILLTQAPRGDLRSAGGCNGSSPSGSCTTSSDCDSTSPTCCNGTCVSTTGDPNCGACGANCSAIGATCAKSVVGSSVTYGCKGAVTCGATRCAAGDDCCGSTCTNVAADPFNCGACGNKCPLNELCAGGSCVCGGAACAAGQTCCATGCSNLQSDSSNCGICGNPCPAATHCMGGACVPGAPDSGSGGSSGSSSSSSGSGSSSSSGSGSTSGGSSSDGPCAAPGDYCGLNPCCGGDGTTCVAQSGQTDCLYSGGTSTAFCFAPGGPAFSTVEPCCPGSVYVAGSGCLVTQGGYCDNVRFCASQLPCMGTKNAGLSGPNAKYAGICQPFCALVGGQCGAAVNTNCCGGLTCSSGLCVANGATGGTTGQSCTNNIDCASLACDTTGVCCVAAGSSCSQDTDCCGGGAPLQNARCGGGKCCLPAGAPCANGNTADSSCCSGYCDSAGQCTK